MGGLFDIEWEGYALWECWILIMTFTFELTHEIYLGFQDQVLKQPYFRNRWVQTIA